MSILFIYEPLSLTSLGSNYGLTKWVDWIDPKMFAYLLSTRPSRKFHVCREGSTQLDLSSFHIFV